MVNVWIYTPGSTHTQEDITFTLTLHLHLHTHLH